MMSPIFSAPYKVLGFGGVFPPQSQIQNEAGLANFFLSVLIADHSKEDPLENTFLQLCYHNGWLQAELTSANDIEVSYVFPSRIHRGYKFSLETMFAYEISKKHSRYIESILRS